MKVTGRNQKVIADVFMEKKVFTLKYVIQNNSEKHYAFNVLSYTPLAPFESEFVIQRINHCSKS